MVNSGNKIYIFELLNRNNRTLDIFFFGVFNCKADAKGRVMLPVSLRSQIAPVLNNGFVIKRSYYEDCLELYPMTEWNTVMRELNELSRYEEENIDFIRKYTASLRQVEIDANGRLLIPKDVITAVGITKNVVLAAIGKRIEIWDKDLYDARISASKEEKVSLARRVRKTDTSGNELS